MSFIGEYYLRTPELPPFNATHFCEYWTANNGVFVRAQRPGLAALLPIVSFPIPIEGLFPLRPRVELMYPRVSRSVVEELLQESWAARDELTQSWQEILFYLRWGNGAWQWTKPEQSQQQVRVTPLLPYEADLPAPLLDIHSHHTMDAFFSQTDTADDYGFRLNAVWGRLDTWPTIRVRVGIYGHFYPVRASSVFDLPPLIRDGFWDTKPEERQGKDWWL